MTYDIKLKDIVWKIPSVFSKTVLGLDVKEDISVIQAQLIYPERRDPDLIFIAGDKLVHIELQSSNDRWMHYRMLEYYLLIKYFCRDNLRRDYKVYQYVIYAGNENLNMKDSVQEDNLNYKYSIVDMRDISCEEILKDPSDEALLLASLCNIDASTLTMEFVNRIKNKDHRSANILMQKLLSLLGLRPKLLEEFKQKHREVVKMPIPVAEHPLFIEGKMEGKIEGKIEGQLESFIDDIKIRFGIQELPEDLQKKIMSIKDLNLLLSYKKLFFKSQTVEEFLEGLKEISIS